MTIILGSSEQGPIERALSVPNWAAFTNRRYAQISLASSGSFTCDDDIQSYRFVGFAPINFWETTPKSTGLTNEYRLKGFPVVAGSCTLQVDGNLVAREFTGTPSAGEYFLDEPSGLLRLGDTPSDLVVTYAGNTGSVKEFEPLSHGRIGNVISWTGSQLQDEVWLEMTPAARDEDLTTCFNRGDFPQDTYALRVDGGARSLCTISATSVGTMVFHGEVGSAGNNWRACWDTDAIYVVRPPGYSPQRVTIPLTDEAGITLRRTSMTTAEEMTLGFKHLVHEASGWSSLTPSTMARFTGGTLASPDWASSLRYIGQIQESLLIPLGLTSSTVAEIFLQETIELGVWPVVLLGSTEELTGVHPNLAITAGTATYSDGSTGSLLHGLAGALSRGAPYYLPSVRSCTPRGLDPRLIYGVDSVRHGWMVTRHPMVSGDLYLNHHLWIQKLVGGARAVLDDYVGQMGVTAQIVESDPRFQTLMENFRAEYRISSEPSHIEVALRVTPPGAVSEVWLNVNRTA